MTEILARLAAAWLSTGVAVMLASWLSTGVLTGWGLLYGWLGFLGYFMGNATGLVIQRRREQQFDENAAIEALSSGVFVDPAELDRLADLPLPRINK